MAESFNLILRLACGDSLRFLFLVVKNEDSGNRVPIKPAVSGQFRVIVSDDFFPIRTRRGWTFLVLKIAGKGMRSPELLSVVSSCLVAMGMRSFELSSSQSNSIHPFSSIPARLLDFPDGTICISDVVRCFELSNMGECNMFLVAGGLRGYLGLCSMELLRFSCSGLKVIGFEMEQDVFRPVCFIGMMGFYGDHGQNMLQQARSSEQVFNSSRMRSSELLSVLSMANQNLANVVLWPRRFITKTNLSPSRSLMFAGLVVGLCSSWEYGSQLVLHSFKEYRFRDISQRPCPRALIDGWELFDQTTRLGFQLIDSCNGLQNFVQGKTSEKLSLDILSVRFVAVIYLCPFSSLTSYCGWFWGSAVFILKVILANMLRQAQSSEQKDEKFRAPLSSLVAMQNIRCVVCVEGFITLVNILLEQETAIWCLPAAREVLLMLLIVYMFIHLAAERSIIWWTPCDLMFVVSIVEPFNLTPRLAHRGFSFLVDGLPVQFLVAGKMDEKFRAPLSFSIVGGNLSNGLLQWFSTKVFWLYVAVSRTPEAGFSNQLLANWRCEHQIGRDCTWPDKSHGFCSGFLQHLFGFMLLYLRHQNLDSAINCLQTWQLTEPTCLGFQLIDSWNGLQKFVERKTSEKLSLDILSASRSNSACVVHSRSPARKKEEGYVMQKLMTGH
ncbi:hypothetical protein Dimus_025598 [Dionaea muscipula]